VVALWRYPVKSMMGEELNACEVTDRGLLGDRRFAVVDRSTGKVGERRIRGSGVISSISGPRTPRPRRQEQTAARHNAVNVGVYASVLSGRAIRRGDPVTLT
jgi:uncharacterized protein YcbX